MKKRCSKCNTIKDFICFSKNKAKLRSYCKDCAKVMKKRWQVDNKEEIKEYSKEYWVKNKEKLSGIKDKDKYKEYHVKYRAENKNIIQKRQKISMSKNKEHYTKLRREWERNNKEKTAYKRARQRASKLNATPKWLTSEHKSQILAFYRAAKDLTVKTGTKHEVDHIYPLRGKNGCGLHVPWNLQVLTKEENQKKSNKVRSLDEVN